MQFRGLFASPAGLLSTVVVTSLLAWAGAAQAADVTLDSVTVSDHNMDVLFRQILVKDTNLTGDEVRKLFSLTTSHEELAGLVGKMTAASLTIPDIQMSLQDGTLNFTGFQMTDINTGHVGKLALTQADGKFKGPDDLPITMHANAMFVEGADFAGTLAALKNQDVGDLKFKTTHMKWDGFDVAFTDKDTPATAAGGNQVHVHLTSLEGSSTFEGDVPLKSQGGVQGLTIVPPPASTLGKTLAQYGYDQLNFGLTFAGTYDPATKSYVMTNYAISEAKTGTLSLQGTFGSLAPTIFTAHNDAKLGLLMQADISTVSLKFENAGGFDTLVTAFAVQDKITPEALRKQWAMMVTQFVPVLLGGDPAGLQIATALNSFLAHPTALTLTASAQGAPLKVTDIMAAQDNPLILLQRAHLTAVTAP